MPPIAASTSRSTASACAGFDGMNAGDELASSSSVSPSLAVDVAALRSNRRSRRRRASDLRNAGGGSSLVAASAIHPAWPVPHARRSAVQDAARQLHSAIGHGFRRRSSSDSNSRAVGPTRRVLVREISYRQLDDRSRGGGGGGIQSQSRSLRSCVFGGRSGCRASRAGSAGALSGRWLRRVARATAISCAA
jgi:hypothetical protein